MADEQIKYAKDPRTACKYGEDCYQKNPFHQSKYKHPKKGNLQVKQANGEPPAKRVKLNNEECKLDKIQTKTYDDPALKVAALLEVEGSKFDDVETDTSAVAMNKQQFRNKAILHLDEKLFIKEKFLVEMPENFYNFWDFCKTLNEKTPAEAFKAIGLYLVGPYDVLAKKFCNIEEKTADLYLTHWRYFHDPPELQTVIKGNTDTAFHIGYFRDAPQEAPVFLASNCANKDGVLSTMGDNIFAAVYLYMQDMKKTGDPFKKMQICKLEAGVKNEAERLKLDLQQKNKKISERNRKVVTKTFNTVGIVVPYNKKSQQGYRELAISDAELRKLLDKISKAAPEQTAVLLSELQPVLTYASIATDECDFATGLELGLDIIAHGVESLNATALRYMTSAYKLLHREEFAKIAEAHLRNRRKGCAVSIL